MPVTLQDNQGSWNHPLRDDGDELWASLENIDQLALKSKEPTPSRGDKQHIRPSPYDGVSLWDNYRTQFQLVA